MRGIYSIPFIRNADYPKSIIYFPFMPHVLNGDFSSTGEFRQPLRHEENNIADHGGGTAPGVVDAQGNSVPKIRHPLDVSGAGFFS
jgi:hypothetical protein